VARERRAHAVGAILIAVLVSLPVLTSLRELGGAAGSLAEQVGFSEKARALGSVLDGSYFPRLMRVGGRFDAMFSGKTCREAVSASRRRGCGPGNERLRRRAPPRDPPPPLRPPLVGLLLFPAAVGLIT
jgi:hypothetical protein